MTPQELESMRIVRGMMIIEASERFKNNPKDPKIKKLVDDSVGLFIYEALHERGLI